MMKHFTLRKLVLSAALCFSCLLANAYDFEVDGIYYEITSAADLTAQVTYKSSSYNSYSGDIVIPDTVVYGGHTLSVTAIGASAFRKCSDLKSIILGNSVKSIGSSAFYYCSGLKEIALPNAVRSIGTNAFEYCTSLVSATIGDSLKSIGKYAFRRCTSLNEINLPDALTSIGDEAFYYCSSLTSIVIPDAVTSIGTSSAGGAFGYCSSLINATIGDGVTSIERETFYKCTSLKEVSLPDALTSIGSSAFYGCTSLASVVIPNAVTSIGDYAFEYCDSLTTLTIGDFVSSIGTSAFLYCTALTDVYSLNSTPPSYSSSSDCFSMLAYLLATLHVPADAVDTYAAATMWKEFNTIVGDAETAGISAVNVDNDNYKVSADGGMVNVTGLGNGERMTVYTADGRMVGAMAADGGSASISAPKGVAIVRVGNKTLKVAVH